MQELLLKEERFWSRLKCNYITVCHDSLGNRCTCKIIDISGRGLGIVSTAVLRKGERVSIADPKTKAVVVWVANGRAGLRVCT